MNSIDKGEFFSAELLNVRHLQFLYFDESGFNLHISNNYGYLMPNTDAVLSVVPSRGRNISLCAILSTSGLIDFTLVDVSFTSALFCDFIHGCAIRRSISSNTLIIMDNASIHHTRDVKNTLDTFGVPFKYLPEYSPDFNPIDNVFSVLKAKVSSKRPVASDRETLKTYII
ncbi:hypothetical protein DMUE_1310 [Dictyocoela muelleri]|nr:hypothetical protein DMUE_1310 [Dictyocoela muelleri]